RHRPGCSGAARWRQPGWLPLLAGWPRSTSCPSARLRRLPLFFSCLPRSELHVFKKILHTFEPALGSRRLIAAFGLQRITQLVQQLALALGQVDRRLDHHAAEQIARRTTTHRHYTLAAQAEQLTGLGAFRNLQLDPTIQ